MLLFEIMQNKILIAEAKAEARAKGRHAYRSGSRAQDSSSPASFLSPRLARPAQPVCLCPTVCCIVMNIARQSPSFDYKFLRFSLTCFCSLSPNHRKPSASSPWTRAACRFWLRTSTVLGTLVFQGPILVIRPPLLPCTFVADLQAQVKAPFSFRVGVQRPRWPHLSESCPCVYSVNGRTEDGWVDG